MTRIRSSSISRRKCRGENPASRAAVSIPRIGLMTADVRRRIWTRHYSRMNLSLQDSMKPWRDERKDDGDNEQHDDDPLEDLHAPADQLIGDLLIDALQRFEFSQNAGIPLCKVKSLRGQPVNAGKILVAQKLERVVDTFEQNRAVDLPLRYIAKIGSQAQHQLAGAFGQAVVSKAERIIESLIQESHLQQFDICKFKHGQNVFGVFADDQGGVPIHDHDIIYAERNSMRQSVDHLVFGQFASLGTKDLSDVLSVN